MTIEKAMQFIKGGFSYRLKKEYRYLGESGSHALIHVQRQARRPARRPGQEARPGGLSHFCLRRAGTQAASITPP